LSGTTRQKKTAGQKNLTRRLKCFRRRFFGGSSIGGCSVGGSSTGGFGWSSCGGVSGFFSSSVIVVSL
jgi:hypothetical protein